MTVIFHTNAGAPVLAGDMLISVSGPIAYTDLRLPSHPNGIAVPSDVIPSHLPILMRRKVFVVNDHLAVGVAGSVFHAPNLVSDLSREFRDRSEFTRDELTGFLERYGSNEDGQETLEQTGALVLAKATDWQGSLTKRLLNERKVVTRRFGRAIAIGTGTDSVIEQIQRLDNETEWGSAQPPDGARRFPEFDTLAQNLILLGHLYWKEFTSQGNVFDAWGGAYDLIYQDPDGHFRYLDEYTIVLRLLDMDNLDKGIQLSNVIKYERRTEVSLMAMLNNGKLDFFGAKDITASDEPISVTIGKDLSMNSRVNMSIIGVGKGNRYMLPLIQIDGLDPTDEGRQTVFMDFDDEGRLRVFLNAEHDRWLEEQATSYFAEFAHRWS